MVGVVGGLYFSSSADSRTKKTASEGPSLAFANSSKPGLREPLAWPTYGQAAYGAVDQGALAVSSSQAQPVPIASLAKTITALAVLKKKPLKVGELGPSITMTEADVALYNDYLSREGSVAKVEVGQQLSQYHAMQAVLMMSANNIADSLAIWAFGSMEAYTEYANSMLGDMDLSHIRVADASGFSPQTVGTAEEMVQVATEFMRKPVLYEITTTTGAEIPITGAIPNYNAHLNTGEFVGVKAGNTDQAGRCFISASLKNGKVFSVAVVLGADRISTATIDSQSILRDGNSIVEKSR